MASGHSPFGSPSRFRSRPCDRADHFGTRRPSTVCAIQPPEGRAKHVGDEGERARLDAFTDVAPFDQARVAGPEPRELVELAALQPRLFPE